MRSLAKSVRTWRRLLKRRRRELYALTILLTALVVLPVLARPSRPYDVRVANAMRTTFKAYWRECAGRDELLIDGGCEDWLFSGVSAIDAADTLLMMGLRRDYALVREWLHADGGPLSTRIHNAELNIFETTIRVLGGANAVYGMTNDSVWLSAGIALGDLLLPAFDTLSGCPLGLYTGASKKRREYERFAPNTTGVADAGTLQLEFRTLSVLTGDSRYAAAADRCMRALIDALPSDRVVPSTFDVVRGKFLLNSGQSIGAQVDSFIEMLLKVYIGFGKKDSLLLRTFLTQVDSILNNLIRREGGTMIIGSKERWQVGLPSASMEHLSCFFPGVLALAHKHCAHHPKHDLMYYARELTRTCYLMTRATSEGLSAESSFVLQNGELYPSITDTYLRPEVIEAVYVMYKVTGDGLYRMWARQMWRDMERSALHGGVLTPMQNLGYSSTRPFSKLHSFVLAETLKYFYLIFRDDGPDLEHVVFNTEAHPVRIRVAPPATPLV